MLIPPGDNIKNDIITRSQANKNPTLAKEIEQTSQGPLKPKWKTRENSDKFSKYSETSSACDQTDLLDISVRSISVPEISTPNKSIIETKNPESIFRSIENFHQTK